MRFILDLLIKHNGHTKESFLIPCRSKSLSLQSIRLGKTTHLNWKPNKPTSHEPSLPTIGRDTQDPRCCLRLEGIRMRPQPKTPNNMQYILRQIRMQMSWQTKKHWGKMALVQKDIDMLPTCYLCPVVQSFNISPHCPQSVPKITSELLNRNESIRLTRFTRKGL
jgi:hypothetical protein